MRLNMWEDVNKGLDASGKVYGVKQRRVVDKLRSRGLTIPSRYKTNMDYFCEKTGKYGGTMSEFFQVIYGM
jgi:hypothetical protein